MNAAEDILPYYAEGGLSGFSTTYWPNLSPAAKETPPSTFPCFPSTRAGFSNLVAALVA